MDNKNSIIKVLVKSFHTDCGASYISDKVNEILYGFESNDNILTFEFTSHFSNDIIVFIFEYEIITY